MPSGRDVIITAEESVTGVQSNGDRIYVDENTLRFTPTLDYRGPAAINFTVTDGSTAKDPKGNVSTLRLNITVGDPEFRDEPPVFTAPSVNIEVGEEKVLDLRASTAHPNPQILQQVTYSNLTGTGASLTGQLSGSQLTLTTPRNTRAGTTFTLGVTLRWDKFEVPGTINVTVVSSSKPLAVAVSDKVEAKRGAGAAVVPVLANDSNPFQSTGEALTVIDATVENTGQPASVSFTATSVRIVPNPNLKSGQIDVTYRISDATDDPSREVNGTVTLIVSDVPDQVAKPQRTPNSNIGGDETATFVFAAPATNGKPITSYDIQTDPAIGNLPSCTAGASCALTGLTNGTAYKLSARAINEHGAGAWSNYSDVVTPYGTPGTPAPALSNQSKWAPANLTWTWPAVDARGGSTTYFWNASNGASGSGSATSATISGVGAGTYTIAVYAKNSGGRDGATGTSAGATVRTQPAPTAPQNVTAERSKPNANATVSFRWSAPSNASADAAGDGMKYRWSTNTGASGSGVATSANLGSVGQGTYTITVVAYNSGGEGPSATASVTVEAPLPPPPDPKTPRIVVASGQSVNNSECTDASCAYVGFKAYDLAANTSYQFCNSVYPTCHTGTTDGNGNVSGQFTAYYGYPNGNVTVTGGGQTDTRLWKNAERL